MKGVAMRHARYFLVIIALLACAGLGKVAEGPPYDEKADASKQVAAALAEASKTGKSIVLIFGANWCPDCRALDAQMHKPELPAIVEKNFVVVKIDVGRMNKNVELAQKYGVPVKRGIPALAVLDSQGKLLYAMDQGQFADARHMSYESIKEFFVRWQPSR
jgi:thioredoxin 1